MTDQQQDWPTPTNLRPRDKPLLPRGIQLRYALSTLKDLVKPRTSYFHGTIIEAEKIVTTKQVLQAT